MIFKMMLEDLIGLEVVIGFWERGQHFESPPDFLLHFAIFEASVAIFSKAWRISEFIIFIAFTMNGFQNTNGSISPNKISLPRLKW